jgi:GNAT superfamily N-acetyltransferase
MDTRAVLARYDEQVRRHPQPEPPDGIVEDDGRVVRHIAPTSGWSGVVWSDLDEGSADAAIAAQVERFAKLGGEWEWKHHSHDRPPDLPQRLVAAGFTPEPQEALLVAEIAALDLGPAAPPGIDVYEVAGADDAADLVAVHHAVFGEDHSALRGVLLAALERDPVPVVGVVAYAGAIPVAAARVEFNAGTEFASLWGGGTLPEWRGRGVFRALVAQRARMAAARGFRYVQVDAMPMSRPILRRLGFVELATTTPYVHPGTPPR